jgi:hypothetical protein
LGYLKGIEKRLAVLLAQTNRCHPFSLSIIEARGSISAEDVVVLTSSEVLVNKFEMQELKSKGISVHALFYHLDDNLVLSNTVFLVEKKTGRNQFSSIQPFLTPSDVQWEDVHLTFITEEKVRIKIKNIRKEYSYSEMGFANKRNGYPISPWSVLYILSEKQGEIGWDSSLDSKLI